jgi:hypothetical protein
MLDEISDKRNFLSCLMKDKHYGCSPPAGGKGSLCPEHEGFSAGHYVVSFLVRPNLVFSFICMFLKCLKKMWPQHP